MAKKIDCDARGRQAAQDFLKDYRESDPIRKAMKEAPTRHLAEVIADALRGLQRDLGK